MSAPGFDSAVAASATSAQRAAADPAKTVFVRANAGSGKTRVLVDRVARLLLEGVRPERILCVTFTKAAAGEMQTRLFRKLGDWSVMGDDKLQAELKALTGEEADADPARLAEARKLFARALETPGGLKVQTLHAFCDSLLRQFPLEAGLPPGFATQEDAQSARARREAELAVYRAARGRGGEALAAAIDEITVRAGPTGFEQIFKAATKHRHHLSALFEEAQGEEPLIREAARVLGVEAGGDEAAVKQDFIAGLDLDALQRCADAIRISPAKYAEADAEKLYAPLRLARTGDWEKAFEAYSAFMLTGSGTLRASLYVKPAEKTCPDLNPLFGPEGSERARMAAALNQLCSLRLHALTAASLTLARGFLIAYEQRLARERAVDFADLVVRAARLLKDSEWADWVRYKLDGGLEHILVDEAQDTAPEQWDVIDALAAEFFAGEGRERGSSLDRTVFCVGDEKQSIYAFQNADPARFMEQGAALKMLAGGAGLGFAEPGLNVSFRSAPEVLKAVDLAFEDLRAALETKAFLEAEHKKYLDEGKTVEPLAPVKLPISAYAGHDAAR
ncbi:MAG: UvrD-helicase domain-containing protein, partial [Glycocaulis sp.]